MTEKLLDFSAEIKFVPCNLVFLLTEVVVLPIMGRGSIEYLLTLSVF